MSQHPISDRFAKHGCDSCKAAASEPSCYTVEFHFHPTKLVRKHHRDREQTVIYCKTCYDTEANLPVLIDGKEVGLRKTGITSGGAGLPCKACGTYFPYKQGLYGTIASSLWMSGTCTEGVPLACFCPDCVEKVTIALCAKI